MAPKSTPPATIIGALKSEHEGVHPLRSRPRYARTTTHTESDASSAAMVQLRTEMRILASLLAQPEFRFVTNIGEVIHQAIMVRYGDEAHPAPAF